MQVSGGTLADLKEQLIKQIDAEAAEVRKRFVTLDDGQEGVYIKKENEARRFLADPSLTAVDVPHVFKEAPAWGVDPATMAAMIVASADDWMNRSALIEFTRVAAKRAVEAATTANGARTAAVLDWSAVYNA